jgi:hypothetical protein
MISFGLRRYEKLPMVHFIMDCRAKPGNNNIEQWLWRVEGASYADTLTNRICRRFTAGAFGL